MPLVVKNHNPGLCFQNILWTYVKKSKLDLMLESTPVIDTTTTPLYQMIKNQRSHSEAGGWITHCLRRGEEFIFNNLQLAILKTQLPSDSELKKAGSSDYHP